MTTVTFLGVGAALPAPGETNSAYLIESGDVRLLFDCGPAILQQLAAVGKSPGDITHVFFSHSHGDHALGWPMFLLWWSIESRARTVTPPVVLASVSTWSHLRLLWEHSYGELPTPAFTPIELNESGSAVELTNTITLHTYPMVHSSRFHTLGARFVERQQGRSIGFTADTARCDNILLLARDVELLVHEARYAVSGPPESAAQAKYHCSAQDAGEFAQAAGAKQLALVHIGAEYQGRHADLIAEAKTRFTGPVFAPRGGDAVRL